MQEMRILASYRNERAESKSSKSYFPVSGEKVSFTAIPTVLLESEVWKSLGIYARRFVDEIIILHARAASAYRHEKKIPTGGNSHWYRVGNFTLGTTPVGRWRYPRTPWTDGRNPSPPTQTAGVREREMPPDSRGEFSDLFKESPLPR